MSPSERRLDARVADVRGHLERRATFALVWWIAAGAGLVLFAAWWFAGADGWRPGSDAPLLLDVLIVLWAVASVVLYRRTAPTWFAEAPLAGSIERAAGIRSGTLRGSLELSRSVPAGVSRSLVGQAADRVVADLGDRGPDELAGDLGDRVTLWTRRGMSFFAGLAVVLALMTVLSPSRSAAAWSALSTPFATAKDPFLAPLVVTPGTTEVLRGTDVQLLVEAQGRLQVVLSWQAAGDVARTETLVVDQGRASFVFRSVGAPIEYEVRGDDGSTTDTYRITPIDPLFVSDLIVRVEYPPHTGISPDEYRGDPPSLRLPVGTSLSFEGRASRVLSEGALVDSAGAGVLTLDVDGTAFQAEWTPNRSGRFEWRFADGAGAAAEIQPEPLELALVPDSAPRIRIPFPGQDTIMAPNLQQPLVLEAGDDYGLERLELVAYRVTAFGDRREPVVQGLNLGGTRAALARPLLDVRSWGLMPGDTVRYFARVVDNSPARQEGITPEYVLRMPAAAEMQREAEERLEEVAQRLQELADEAARESRENEEAARESAAESQPQNRGLQGEQQPESDFQEQEELAQALADQQEISAEVDSLRAELDELERLMEDAGQSDPELAKELEELQELMRQMNGSELQQRMEELAEALDQDDLQEANQALAELSQEQDDLRQRLEESLERFKRAAVEQDLRATTSEAEDLARQERAIADAMREEDAPELRAEQQRSVEQQAEQLQEQMDRLQERLDEIGEQEAAADVRQASDQMQQARQEMRQAGDQADQGDSQQAGEKADEAASELEEVAEALKEAQQQMQQQQAQAAQEALSRTADDALSLARQQSELRDRMRGASQEQVAGMRGDEASLLQGVRNMAENLQLATQGATPQDGQLSAQMGRAMESIQNTIEAMESRRGAAPSPFAQAETSIGDLNQLALMAIAGAEQMGQSGEGQAGQDVAEQLEQLAQQQGEVMNQTGQMMPLELGQEAMSEQMQQLSQGQQSVASDIGELADQPGSEESLGDLDQLAAEAQELAAQMAQGRLTPDIVERQERLFHRLLDAGRSLEREEFSEERESERPESFEPGQVVPLTADQLGALRYGLPDAAQLQGLSPAVRQLVLSYFERLNRGGGGS